MLPISKWSMKMMQAWMWPVCERNYKQFYWDSGLKRKGQQSLMGWGLLQRNLQEGIWGAIRIKNAHPFGTDTLIRVYFAFHGHIFRICKCMSCRWFLAQSSSKATGGTKQYQQSLHKVWFLTTKSRAIRNKFSCTASNIELS